MTGQPVIELFKQWDCHTKIRGINVLNAVKIQFQAKCLLFTKADPLTAVRSRRNL